ncbi:MAG: 3-oxoacyl-[acyl-carrier protein] reductase [Desulfobacteraceae bacterium Eth-SRB1]|nr:MAG: 3-oxoacyl-[acyl-carrier protein] reductase [Desulfobacteraceae bacterium Eth-SRB1]
MNKKVMVITGTRKGIGRYLSEYYLGKNFIVIGCSRSESDLKHEKYEHFCLDVADEKAVNKMISAISKKYGKIDYLINNAGIASMNHSLLTPLSVVEKVFKTNVFGTFVFCREAGKIMAKNKFGRIINFATIATPLKMEGESVYAASKSAIESITKILAKEFSTYNITVNAIGPTPIYTDLIKNVPKEKMDSLLNMQTINRYGEFDDISNVIDFFISDKSNFITGQVIFLGGVSY